VQNDTTEPRASIRLEGAASFVRLAALTDALEKMPADRPLHIYMSDLEYIDHAALEAISGWEQQRKKNGQVVEVEWTAAYRVYHDNNPLSGSAAGPMHGAASGH
jgi:MFS superfamily sulfate permease-like transporter